MRILFAGTPAAALPTLSALVAAGHEVVGVLTQPPAPAGRGRNLKPSPVAEFASQQQLPLLQPEAANDPRAVAEIAALRPEVAVVVAYGQLLKVELLAVPPLGWLNLHFSLLPEWRGAAPVQRAIIAGDEVTGATVFQLDAGMDTGPILGRLALNIGADETAGELLERLAVAGAPLVVQVLDAISRKRAVAEPQDEAAASYAPKLQPAEARLDWRHPALAISRRVRGCHPEPGAHTFLSGQRLGIGAVRLTSGEPDLAPGVLRVERQRVLVGSGSVPLELVKVKPAGRGWMAAADWARGVRAPLGHFDE